MGEPELEHGVEGAEGRVRRVGGGAYGQRGREEVPLEPLQDVRLCEGPLQRSHPPGLLIYDYNDRHIPYLQHPLRNDLSSV